MAPAVGLGRSGDSVDVAEDFVVPGRDRPSTICPGVEVWELRRKERSLQRVETRVSPVENVLEPLALSVVPQKPCPFRNPRVAGHDGPAVSQGAQILRR